jgi:two-component sensor histidine kinase
LAVVLNELMQNAVDHAFPHGEDDSVSGTVQVRLRREAGELIIDVVDDGIGVPEGFDLETSKGLGLSIVLALVSGELAGTLDVGPGDGGRGTRFTATVPIATAAATKVVEPS